jgi:signal peptidase I
VGKRAAHERAGALPRVVHVEWSKLKRSLKVILVAVGLLAVAVGSLPLVAGTGTYPLAVVEGNSMYPTLQNGDLVFFHSVPPGERVANGTIVVFVETGTGVTLLDQLLRPVIIHRVVGSMTDTDGVTFYQTKGDNNQQDDPGLTPSYDVMGTPEFVLPKVGLIVLFVQSPQGLVAIVAIISIFYVAKAETKMDEERKERDLLGALAKASLNGELPASLFEEFETAVKYHDELGADELKDPRVGRLVRWINDGGLDRTWELTTGLCSRCSSKILSLKVEAGDPIPLCPACSA